VTIRDSEPTARDTGHPASPDMLVLVGDGKLVAVELRDRELVIGRGRGCDLVVDHASLSRRHAVVRPGPPATVQDLGSTNGTRVAGEVRRGGGPAVLDAGGSFYLGPFACVVMRHAPAHGSSVPSTSPLRIVDPSPDKVSSVVREIARSGVSVLIRGETGVGKEVLASTVHELSGRTGAMTRINCAALSESLLESELFGHERGAFTGAAMQKAGLLEAADRGTVFLDEIGELSPAIQAKLLRAVEQREVLRLGAVRPTPTSSSSPPPIAI